MASGGHPGELAAELRVVHAGAELIGEIEHHSYVSRSMGRTDVIIAQHEFHHNGLSSGTAYGR
jgi:hypothetical protein